MASKPHPFASDLAPSVSAGTGPQHFLPPSARELRAQALQRLQIGLLGLATMLLLVGLANIIMDRARLAESTLPVSAGLPTEQPSLKSDPLADMGVIPSPEAASAQGPLPAAERPAN